VLRLLRSTIADFIADDALTHGAAVAFYAALSLSPVLLLLVYVAGLLGTSQQQAIVQELEKLLGPQAGQAVQTVLEASASNPSAHSVAGLVTLAVIIFSASGVFVQLQYALNKLWNVKPDARVSVWSWLRKRLLSLGMILALGFLLLCSLAASAALSVTLTWLQGFLPGSEILWRFADVGVSLIVFTLLFAIMYRYLPDIVVAWRDVWFGAASTALLFVVGKWLISAYLGQSSFSSPYGAAGSMVALMAWLYYSSLIIFFGAELTQNWAKVHGRSIRPDANAVWSDNDEKESRSVHESQ